MPDNLLVCSSISPILIAVLCLVAQSCLTLCDPMDYSLPGSSVHGDSPGKITGVGGHALLQGIFPTQGLNTGLLHCRQILYHLSHCCCCCCRCQVASVVSDSVRPHRRQPTRLLCPWDFFRLEYWSGLPFPSPGDLPDAGIEHRSPALQADFLPTEI